MEPFNRRKFITSGGIITAGAMGLALFPNQGNAKELNSDDRPNVIGPRDGFAPEVGTLLSMMTWMRGVVLGSVKNMRVEQLDYLHDEKSNTIGSMLLHLAASLSLLIFQE